MPIEIVNILVQLPVLVVFLWYYERVAKINSSAIEKLAEQFQEFLREERLERHKYMAQRDDQIRAMADAINGLKSEFVEHDERMTAAVIRMEERTRPLPPKPAPRGGSTK